MLAQNTKCSEDKGQRKFTNHHRRCLNLGEEEYVPNLDSSDSSEEGRGASEEGWRRPARRACTEGETTSGGGDLLMCSGRRVSAALVLPLRFAPEGAEADDSEEQMPVRRSGCCGAERSGAERRRRWWGRRPPLDSGELRGYEIRLRVLRVTRFVRGLR